MKIFTMKNYLYFLLVAGLLVLSFPTHSVNAVSGVTVSITAPSSVSAGGRFIATVNISQVSAFNGYQFQLTYDPNLIQVDDLEGGLQGVTAGLVGCISVPVDMWTYYPVGAPGVIRLVGRVHGNTAITGNGTLAVIHFRGVGSSNRCDIIPTEVLSPPPPELPFSNKLFDNLTQVIPSNWAGTGVNLIPAPVITTSSLSNGEVGVAYSQNLTASGGIIPLVWSVQSGTLPSGLSLNVTNGSITGTPGVAGGPSPITFNVTDSLWASSAKNLSITILAAPAITTTSLANGEVGAAYSQNLTASGGTLPFVWSIQSGTLPSGLSLNSTSGRISGIPTTAGVATTITFKVTDNLLAMATKDLAITILAGPAITTVSLSNGEVGVAYSQNLTASGGTLPFVWSIQNGSLPTGLSLNATSGRITGIPTTAGLPTTTTFKVTDNLLSGATKDLSITILAAPAITTASLSNGEVGVAYSQNLTASGGTLPFVWSIQSGTLPTGLSLNATSGRITGIPGVSGVPATVTFKVTDNLLAIATKDLSITILAAPMILTTSLPNGTVGANYTYTLLSSGGTLPHTWNASGLPAGLTVSPAGIISGIASVSGNFSVNVFLTDSFFPAATKNTTLSLYFYPQLQITSTGLSDGVMGRSYLINLTAAGGLAPYSWNATGLPAGLTISSNGTITGVPAASGNFSININLNDSFIPANTTSNILPLRIYLRGDATGNDQVNMGDVILIERIILKLSSPTTAADANNDGQIDMQDVTVTERLILGLPT